MSRGRVVGRFRRSTDSLGWAGRRQLNALLDQALDRAFPRHVPVRQIDSHEASSERQLRELDQVFGMD